MICHFFSFVSDVFNHSRKRRKSFICCCGKHSFKMMAFSIVQFFQIVSHSFTIKKPPIRTNGVLTRGLLFVDLRRKHHLCNQRLVFPNQSQLLVLRQSPRRSHIQSISFVWSAMIFLLLRPCIIPISIYLRNSYPLGSTFHIGNT